MDRILESLETLLAEKSFERITIQELGQHSGTAVSSIYARFRDKEALILGIHLRLRERTLECLEQLTDPRRWGGQTPQRMVAAIVPACVKFYRKHGTLIRAILTLDNAEMRERQASVLRFAAERFSALLAGSVEGRTEAMDAAVEFSVRMLASVMYATLLFGEVGVCRRDMSDRELIRHLTHTITAAIEAAQAHAD